MLRPATASPGVHSPQRTERRSQATPEVLPLSVDALLYKYVFPFGGTEGSVSGEPADFAGLKTFVHEVLYERCAQFVARGRPTKEHHPAVRPELRLRRSQQPERTGGTD
jgi:hypothetical protein